MPRPVASPHNLLVITNRRVAGQRFWLLGSFVERQNLTMRMPMRRFIRFTNAHSEKLANHEAAIALHYMHYNFCRIHKTLRVTPAMEAGIANHVWSIEELVSVLPIVAPKPRGPYKKRAKA